MEQSIIQCFVVTFFMVTTQGINLGEKVVDHEFPHLVAIFKDPGFEAKHVCSGNILNEYWILAAAHCTVDFSEGLFVKAGQLSLDNTKSSYVASVETIFLYADQNSKKNHDIALIKLKEPLGFNSQVQPIEISAEHLIVGENVTISGWGGVDPVGNGASQELYKTTMTIIDDDSCMDLLAVVYQNPSLHPNDFCTKGLDGVTTCEKDGGNPVMRMRKNKTFELVGLASWWSDPCGVEGAPSVNVKVKPYLDWITSTLANN
ncbi:hypothetical protein TKK_0008029 [Trichogramma kaykai]